MALHLWRTDLLAQDLAADRVSERSALGYMIASSVLYLQAHYLALWFGAYRDWAFFLELVVVLVVSFFGVHECYKANGGSEGAQFITRYCVLSVPIGLKMALLGVILGHGFYYASPSLLGGGTFSQPQLVYRYVSFIMPVALTFLYFWRIAYHLGKVRASTAPTASSAL